MTTTAPGVALIGTGFMGKCHAMAWRNVSAAFGGVPPRLEVLADTPAGKAAEFARAFGFARATADWRAAVSDPAVDVVSITTPNGMHREMAEAALAAGKHVWLEKPMALTVADAESMAAAAAAAGWVTMLGYNYLRSPAFRHAQALLAEGAIGRPVHFRGSYDEDYMADPALPWSWRLTRAGGGLGALGDLGCHLVSVMLALMGPVASLIGQMDTVIADRPRPEGGSARVENEDQAQALIRFASGASGEFACSRVARGTRCRLLWEVQGTDGTIRFDQERMNELWLFRPGDATEGFTRILTGPAQPGFAAFCPAPGHNFGFNEMKVVEAQQLREAIAGGAPCGPDFAQGLVIERIIHGIARSAETGTRFTMEA